MNRTIKQAVKETGLSADTLRYYEKQGIISSKRHENGYRYYDEQEIAILKIVVVMKYARFSLAEIKSMRELYTRKPETNCAESNELCKNILNSKITELNRAIQSYKKIVTLMEALLPMIESSNAFHNNEKLIDEFIENIFDDIKKGNLT